MTMMKFLLLILLAAATVPALGFVPSPTSGRVTTDLSAARNDGGSVASRRGVIASSLAVATALSLPLTSNAIETYLTEPTEEFKESERQRIEFRKKQLIVKGEFVKVLARLTGESSTQEQLISDLNELRGLVVQTGGLPLGIKKEEMYKVIRSKKAKGFWPTDVEIAYQKLKAEVAYQQSPNTEKDLENPL